ncbi:MAG: exodeoxyribonuclease VII large subunit [Firmicutes bacterium]|nr:exodeoxyribonuclease VII large subunit [Bacillota bacterium]MBR4024738.1 exodeoxyribonuclease VII large subunit [Bacillota bacterium]MBR6956048.1 exodeoxyribonuclease VII large subunit [Bacillota bacterium]
MALRPITVTQLNDYIARVFDSDTLLMNVAVTGEISNLKYHSSGHVYFSLNDENSKVNCFLPSSYVKNLSYELGDGLEITASGKVNVYRRGGYYSLFVRSIQVAGEGNLSMAFQLMKEKLEKEGLFDPAHKRPIPAFPHKIGILTSSTGAAVKDIIKIIRSKNELVDILIFPVQVQGEGAAQNIAETLKFVNDNYDDIDTLIVGRGGGSQEDLWAFNEEVLARAIYASRIPVISAVGHEIDFSISDFVADLRAETPTAAADIAVPDIGELVERLNKFSDEMLIHLKNKLSLGELRTEKALNQLKSDLEMLLLSRSNEIEKLKLILEQNDPHRIMERGYTVIESEGRVIRTPEELTDGEYDIVFRSGKVRVKIENV